jgi:copper transporter 1
MNMDMTATLTTGMAGMPMPTSTDDPSSSTTTMGMSQMAMTFFTSASTPLFSLSWSPSSIGQYTGTCIFLIALAIILRALLAARFNIIEVLAAIERKRTGGVNYPYVDTPKPTTRRPWRAHEAVILASMDVVLAGVGYLLSVRINHLTLVDFAKIE